MPPQLRLAQTTKRKNEGARKRFAAAVGFLMKKPRTPRELCELLGMQRGQIQIYKYLEALKDEGLVYIVDWAFRTPEAKNMQPVYAWQPSVCHHCDVPKPVDIQRAKSLQFRVVGDCNLDSVATE